MAAPVIRQPHMPKKLENTNTMRKLKRNVIEGIEKGLSVEDACILAGIPRRTYYRWKAEAIEDLEDGYTGTNLQEFIFGITKADKKLFAKLNEHMWDKVEEGDSRIMMYLADNRFGYANKRKNTLELETKEDKGIEINIVNMTGVDTDNTEPIDVDYEVNDGNSRDDSNTTTLD